jgi:tetratricopeptide (TPR) repeat protein
MLSAVFSRQGHIEEARQRLQHAQGQLPANPLAREHFPVLIAEVELSIAEKRWEEAISHSSSLLDWFTRAGRRWNVAHTLLELAEIYRLRGGPGDRERAIDLYDQARVIFAEIGATGYVEIVKNRLL